MTNPTTPLGEATASMHEMFVTLQNAGFSHDDALKLVQGILSDGIVAMMNATASGDAGADADASPDTA